MNKPAPPPQQPALPGPPPKISRRRDDSEFLPAAIEILETPPSPNSMAFLLAICAFVTLAFLWSFFGRIDIIAIAHGKIQPIGRVQIIQPTESAKVARIHARNGESVAAGDVLIELDDADARADLNAAANALAAFRAERLRRQAVLAAAETLDLRPRQIDWPDAIPMAVRSREQRVLNGDLDQIASTVASNEAQVQQKEAERTRLTETLAAQMALIEVLQERVTMRSTLVEKGAGPLTGLIDAKENLRYHSTNSATTKGQLAEAQAAIEVLRRDRTKAINSFIAENRQKLADAERQADESEQKLEKARAHIARMTLISPIAGTVGASTVATIGQVVASGEEIMRIVPRDAQLEVEAYLENKDVGFVRSGQEAVVKVDTFPFTRYGSINARVKQVASDAIPDSDAQQQVGDPAKSTRSSGFAGAQKTQNLVYPVALSLDRDYMNADGTRVQLAAGMAVSVEIRTGDRRIIDYLFSPLVETGGRALRER